MSEGMKVTPGLFLSVFSCPTVFLLSFYWHNATLNGTLLPPAVVMWDCVKQLFSPPFVWQTLSVFEMNIDRQIYLPKLPYDEMFPLKVRMSQKVTVNRARDNVYNQTVTAKSLWTNSAWVVKKTLYWLTRLHSYLLHHSSASTTPPTRKHET